MEKFSVKSLIKNHPGRTPLNVLALRRRGYESRDYCSPRLIRYLCLDMIRDNIKITIHHTSNTIPYNYEYNERSRTLWAFFCGRIFRVDTGNYVGNRRNPKEIHLLEWNIRIRKIKKVVTTRSIYDEGLK